MSDTGELCARVPSNEKGHHQYSPLGSIEMKAKEESQSDTVQHGKYTQVSMQASNMVMSQWPYHRSPSDLTVPIAQSCTASLLSLHACLSPLATVTLSTSPHAIPTDQLC